MYRIVFIIIFLFVINTISSQSIGLQFGTNLVNEKTFLKPRPFTFIGLSYQNKGIITYITYTFDLKIITIGHSIPLYNFKKNKTYAKNPCQ